MELNKTTGMILAFIGGIVIANNWSKVKHYTSDVCEKALSFIGLKNGAK